MPARVAVKDKPIGWSVIDTLMQYTRNDGGSTAVAQIEFVEPDTYKRASRVVSINTGGDPKFPLFQIAPDTYRNWPRGVEKYCDEC